MESLEIQATNDTPYIFCNYENSEVSLTGRSLPENPLKIYEQIFRWAEQYDKEILKLQFKLEYFNTASSKQLFTLIKTFVDNKNVRNISVKWHFEEGDYDSKETGEHFSYLFKIPFEFIEYAESGDLK